MHQIFSNKQIVSVSLIECYKALSLTQVILETEHYSTQPTVCELIKMIEYRIINYISTINDYSFSKLNFVENIK